MLLNNYNCYHSEFFTSAEVAEIHQMAEQIPLDEGRIGNNQPTDPDGADDLYNVNNEIRQSEVKWFDEKNPMAEHIVEKIHDGVGAMARHCQWEWEYTHLEPLQYTIYKHQPDKPTGDFYTWHTDSGADAYDIGEMRKLSFTIQLSHPDEYEGGHFEWLEPNGVFDNLRSVDKTINIDDIKRRAPFSAKEKGSLIVFPSFVHHQVTPVTRGTRISLVGWLVGKPYL